MAPKAKKFNSENATLNDARIYLNENISVGTKCPCCEQRVQLYKRKINTVMARTLIRLFTLNREKPTQEYFHVKDIVNGISATGTNDFSKLYYWSLIKEKPKESNNTKNRTSGYWKITEKGIRFVLKNIEVPKYVKIYNTKAYGFSEEKTDIVGALSEKFNYTELMS